MTIAFMQDQSLAQLKVENSELRDGFEEALREAESLKQENEQLRRLQDDAALDK